MPGTNFSEIIRKFCCCKGDRSTDYERLITGGGGQGDEYAIITNSNGGPTHTGGSARPGLSESGGLTSQARSREEEEEDIMNKILDRTQQSIIDVTNLENNALDFDLIQRSRLYSDAVKRHDNSAEKRRGLFLGDGDSGVVPLSMPALLNNVGCRAVELLSQSDAHPCQNELALLSEASELFMESLRMGAQIECKEELIVYMSWDE